MELDAQLAGAQFAMDAPDSPQILITIAARFGRVSWKYSSLANSLILRDVGVLTQTLYLMADEMGLGGCAIGSGNIDPTLVYTYASNALPTNPILNFGPDDKLVITDFTETVDEDRACQAVAGFAFVEFLAGLATKFRILQPVEGEERPLQPAKFSQRRGNAVLARV